MTKLTLPLSHSFESFISILNLGTLSDDYEFYYRGCSEHNWKYNITPGIYRVNKDGDSYIHTEDKHFREMILRSPNDFMNEKTTLEKLVKMQHYRLPTRLLDITSNPLAALFFACQTFDEKKPRNGKVYVIKIPKEEIKYYDSDAVSLVSNLAKLNIDKTDFSDDFGYLIHEIREEKPHYIDTLQLENERDIKKVFPVKVKLNNNRIVRQSGAFLLFGMRNLISKEKSAIFPKYTIDKEIIIDKISKEGLLQLLDSLAINENTLFPELDHQANYLDRY